MFRDTDGWPKWFSRGWTLQELIAPEEIIFFNAEWEKIENGTKRDLARSLFKITGIPTSILRYGLDSEQPCAAQIMSWAADRKTTRMEDRAYSLMGLFGVYMPMLYGEGRNAFRRLQLEILRATNDHSIFSWDGDEVECSNVLAEDIRLFKNCGDVVRMEPEEYRQLIEEDIPEERISQEQLLTCSVTNAGIQIWLPVRQLGDSHLFEATLACKNTFGPIRIGLVLVKSKHHRYHRYPDDGDPLQFQQLFLAYNEKTRCEKTVFQLNDSSLAQHDFIPEHVYPEDITSTENISVPGNDRAAVSYLNQETATRFAVVLGSCDGQGWAHLTVPRPGSSITNHADTAQFDTWVWTSGSEQVHAISETGKTGKGCYLVKRLHLSCSISDIRLLFPCLPQKNTFSIALDIVQCAGCCISNDRWKLLDMIPIGEGNILRDATAVLTPNALESLLVDRIPTTFARNLIERGLQLGDFGNWTDDTFVCEGNIFDQPTSVALDQIQHEICDRREDRNEGDCVKFGVSSTLCLRQPQCLSLPYDKRVKELLKYLSAHLQGRCLVTTVVRCSELYLNKFAPWLGTWPNYDEPEDTEWEKVSISVPLFVPTRPLIWNRGQACKDTRAYFEQIRKHFDVLSKSGDHRVPDVEVAADFLSSLFSAETLKGYIGEIEFFHWIHTIWCDHTKCCPPEDWDKEIQYPETPCADSLGQVGVVCPHSRIESLTQSLVEKMPSAMDGSTNHMLWQCCNPIAESAVCKVFGTEVVRLIAMAYQKSQSDSDQEVIDESGKDTDANTLIRCDHEGCDGGGDNRGRDHMDLHCIKILFGQVEELQARLDECEDDDEKRALEEDITGKILLACCRGVYHELAQVLSKVVARLVHDKGVECGIRDSRVMFLHEIGNIFAGVAGRPNRHHLDHLWRLTSDAEAGISKHRLLLDARKHSVAMLEVRETSAAGQSCGSALEELKRTGPCDMELDPPNRHALEQRKPD